MDAFLLPLLGGLLIGLAATLHLLAQGKIAGISGILGASLRAPLADGGARLSFLAGLVGVGIVAGLLVEDAASSNDTPLALVALSGLLVGFGARRGSGCTAGHGICGIGRLSRRSIVATLTFMATAALTVFLTRHVLGGA